MPVSYCFKKVGTKEMVPLNLIDDEVCKMCGKEPDNEKFSLEFQCLTMLGTSVTFHGGPSTEKGTEDAIDRMMGGKDRDHPDDSIILQMYRRFLYKEYIFDSWR